jgi:hypothetical protein
MALLDLVFVAFGLGLIAVLQAIWYALLQQVADVIWEQLATVPATLAAMLWVDIAEHVDFLIRTLDFVTYHWPRNCFHIGLGCGCWLLLTVHPRPRFWAFLPFRYIWNFLLFLHFSLWALSVRSPVDRELDHLLPNIFLFPREVEIRQDSPAHVDDGPAEDSQETEMEPPKKVYKGPVVKSLRSKNGLINSAPVTKSK